MSKDRLPKLELVKDLDTNPIVHIKIHNPNCSPGILTLMTLIIMKIGSYLTSSLISEF